MWVTHKMDFELVKELPVLAIIHFWKPIKDQFRRSLREQPDIHAQLMAIYPQGESRPHFPINH
ncbi:hypothetical protein C0992_003782 [Termitomyces sp. T32_za158]|nr:hypothetical protein C0992_003782 [Termitomyces sp. T32_za158]